LSIINDKHNIVGNESKFPLISIYDTSTLKKKKVLGGIDVGSKEYVSIAFTSDAKMIVAQGDSNFSNYVSHIYLYLFLS